MSAGPVLVTGGAGFIGCNVADRLAREGTRVRIFDSLARPGVERNVAWISARHPELVVFEKADLRDADALGRAVADASAIFHFAAQVAVTTSLVDPLLDFDVNLQGTLRLLEAVRTVNAAVPVIFASTNKVYGDLVDLELRAQQDAWHPADPAIRASGIPEHRPLDFHTPYGCSKGAADQYVLDYARSFGLRTAVLRMSCIYGPRQMGTEDQGWVAHFLLRAMAGEEIQIFGDGRQVRDIMYVDDAVDAYLRLRERIDECAGHAFNLGGGAANAVSLRELVAHLETLVGREVRVRFHAWRRGDQRYYVSDIARARAALDLPEPLPWREGIARLHAAFRDREDARRAEKVA